MPRRSGRTGSGRCPSSAYRSLRSKAKPVFSVGRGREKLFATQRISDRESKVSEMKCVHPRYLPPEREAPLVWRPQPRRASYGTCKVRRGSARVSAEASAAHPSPMFLAPVEATHGSVRAAARKSGRGAAHAGPKVRAPPSDRRSRAEAFFGHPKRQADSVCLVVVGRQMQVECKCKMHSLL